MSTEEVINVDTLYVILYIVAAICFAVAAFWRDTLDPNTPRTRNGIGDRINFVALGLLFWVCVPLIQTIDSMD